MSRVSRFWTIVAGSFCLTALVAATGLVAADRPRPAPSAPARDPVRDVKELAKKELELDRLRGEIELLRKSVAADQSILLRVQVVELDCRNPAAEALVPSQGPSTVLPAQVTERLDALLEQGAAKRLADPWLMTMNGRRVGLQVGGEIQIDEPADDQHRPQFKEFGIRVDATPRLLGKDRIQVQLQVRHETPIYEEGATRPSSLSCSAINSLVELQAGQTILLGGLRAQSHHVVDEGQGNRTISRDSATIFLLTAELGDNSSRR